MAAKGQAVRELKAAGYTNASPEASRGGMARAGGVQGSSVVARGGW